MKDWTAHPAYLRVFRPEGMTLGVFFPIEAYRGDVPNMVGQERLARRAEELGFAALWFRDVPLRDPSFGDVGQIFDPWVYLAHVGAHTREIALVTGAIVLPLRHPLHVAKAAASVDRLTGSRLILGVASGDREAEFAAFGVSAEDRGESFRRNFEIMRRAWTERFPDIDAPTGRVLGLDPIPKPTHGDIPVLVAGRGQQSLEWIAHNADGWVAYPRVPAQQAAVIRSWRAAQPDADGGPAPFAQSLYIDLDDDPNAAPRPIHLGYALGRERLIATLEELEAAGVAHVAFNLKYGTRPAGDVLEELGMHVLPRFPSRLAEASAGVLRRDEVRTSSASAPARPGDGR